MLFRAGLVQALRLVRCSQEELEFCQHFAAMRVTMLTELYTHRLVALIRATMETRLPAIELEAVRSCFHRKRLIDSFYALTEKLLWRNDVAAKCLDAAIADGVVPAELNESQLILETVALLSLEVPNGGLLQFYWNRPAWVERVPASLRSIGLPALAEVFDRSTATLFSRVGSYSEFRKGDSRQAYSECASRFSFDEFDSAYYDHEEQVYAKTIDFVSQRLNDFVA